MMDKQHDNKLIKSIDVFPWSDYFNTGIPKIDNQHQRLVQLLNRLARHIAFNADIQTLDSVFHELTDYAVYHFQAEEAIWHEYLPNGSLETKHKEEHNNFISTVLNLKAEENTNSVASTIEGVLSFLVSWLASHILENDKYMALVVLAMQSGKSQEHAEEQAKHQLRDGTKLLINIILSAYSSLATNTTQLMKEAAERKKTEQELRISAEQLNRTVQNLDKSNEDLKKQYTDSIKVFAHIIEMRPGIKSGQSKYIIEKAMLIAHALGMNSEEHKNLMYAGFLMKIGKMSFPDALLETPFNVIPLADKQRYLKHAVEGETLLNGLTQLKGASILIRHQYERYDGSGLPDGLAKQSIPMGSRILSVVSDYIAYLDGSMTGTVMSVNTALSQLVDRKGSYYDPDVIDALGKILKDTTLEEDVVVKLPEVKKSWKSSFIHDKSREKKFTALRSVVEISWPQLKIGMDIESVYFGDKPYIRNCVVDKKIISDILSISERINKDPIIKIRT